MTRRSMAYVLLILGIALLVIIGALGLRLYLQPGEITATPATGSGKALVGGPFELLDQTGRTRTQEDFLGGYTLIYFGYSYCPDVCPTALTVMTQALELLAKEAADKAARVTPIFITVDPARDSVAALAAYAPHFHPRLVALTGAPDKIAEAAKAYRVYYKKVESEESQDYLMDHTSIIYLMGPDGAYLTHFTHLSDAAAIADGLAAQVEP